MAILRALVADESDGDKTQDSMPHMDLASDGLATTPGASEEATTPKADVIVETPATEAADRAEVDTATEAVKAGDSELRFVDDTGEEIATIPDPIATTDLPEPIVTNPEPEQQEQGEQTDQPESSAVAMEVGPVDQVDPSSDDQELTEPLGRIESPPIPSSEPTPEDKKEVEDEKEITQAEKMEVVSPPTPESAPAFAPATTTPPAAVSEAIKISDDDNEPELPAQSPTTPGTSNSQQECQEKGTNKLADIVVIGSSDVE
jgi:hypothetical protein